MLIREALKYGVSELKNSNTPILDARILLCLAMSCRVEEIMIQYESKLEIDILDKFLSYIARRKNLEPISYITNLCEFYNIELEVDNNVLIPRPETELLVDMILQDNDSSNLNILELGTGSGAISIAIAKNSNANITAVDISEEALSIAKRNAKIHNTQINFIKSNWYQEIYHKSYSHIVSNPPYILRSEINKMSSDTIFEPDLALYTEDVNHQYDIIISQAKEYLIKTGKLLLEINPFYRIIIYNLFEKYNFSNIRIQKDLSGYDRVISGEY